MRVAAFLATCTLANAFNSRPLVSEKEQKALDALNSILERSAKNPEKFADEIRLSEFSAIAREMRQSKTSDSFTGTSMPTVMAHGMGDSCFNR